MNIKEFSLRLKERNLLPKNIQFSRWADWTIVSTFNEETSTFISDSVTMGIDREADIALGKALTEYCERSIFFAVDHPAIRAHDHSDGTAAYPAHLLEAKNKVRENALAEAIERFLWAKWWDDHETEYSIKESLSYDCQKLIKDFSLKAVFEIEVRASNSDVALLILLAENQNGGFVTGGAAGGNRFPRAFGELLRHLLASERISRASFEERSFYEQRLWGFASGKWSALVRERISLAGKTPVRLPELSIDQEVPHLNSDLILFHRCLFKDQPIFMGGKVERLCI